MPPLLPRLGLLFAIGWTPACFNTPTPLAPSLAGSVGLPHRGVLTGAARLPAKGLGYHRLRSDAVRWGNPRLVRAIERAAADVARGMPGGADLRVADLSARRGGRIARHRSHRSGRDADLLFYALTPDGRSMDNPGFLHFGPDGLAATDRRDHPFVRLDVPRQWLLVRSLLTAPEAQVQWLFIARPLEALIIEYALAKGEPLDLVWRAQKVLHQPSDSASHDDHIHMRLACTPDEATQGCAGGPRWPWLPPLERAASDTDEELLQALLED
ncbi:MAG: penicillin-insensitive murein endopeptidase [Deltaproteobacteria bacterium]|jgi:penicillin-insensitive murein endopeptidase|nr:penicillin-insensitive murein endopeptidase [Deltaproteobacteria bacterium]MBW2531276.1 penicillin-insensitive murein endopeptidase [Deltaproteobacteria bacterium]